MESETKKRTARLTKPKLSTFARRLLSEWRRLDALDAAERVVVAVSGGADSTALLLALEELMKAGRLAASLRVVVAHLDHGLRGEAGEADARWVASLSRELGFEVRQGKVAVRERATLDSDNLEQAARRARYEFLMQAARECGAKVVLTAHTLDDQAETVLLRLLRGSGADGLCGIEAVRPLEATGEVLLIRPLLSWATHQATVEYCRKRRTEFRRDLMNEDERFTRVRVRKSLLPLLGTFNGRINEALARTATLLRDDAAFLQQAAAELLAAASEPATASEQDVAESPPPLLLVSVLSAAPAALRRRALRQWLAMGRGDLRRLEMVHLLAVESLLAGERGGRRIELPGGATVSRKRGRLLLQKATIRRNTDY